MKITDVMSKLRKLLKENGDIDVELLNDEMDVTRPLEDIFIDSARRYQGIQRPVVRTAKCVIID